MCNRSKKTLKMIGRQPTGILEINVVDLHADSRNAPGVIHQIITTAIRRADSG